MSDDLARGCASLITEFIYEMNKRLKDDTLLAPFINGAKKVVVDPTVSPHPIPEKAPDWLEHALKKMVGETTLHTAVRDVAPRAPLWPVFVNDDLDPAVTDSVIESEFAHWISEDGAQAVALGLAIFGPNADYLPHTHDALEIYFNLSGDLEIQHGVDAKPFTVKPFEYSITPVNRVHSIKTGADPVLVLYIWVGNPVAENWWWETGEDGDWKRTPYRWESDGTWKQVGPAEVVTQDAMDEAHG